MKALGGYFGLQLDGDREYHGAPHDACVRLNTARCALELILRHRKYNRIYLPYYTCDVLLEPVRNTGVRVTFYEIDGNLEPKRLPELKEGEAIVYTNYYGLKQDAVERLADVYGSRLIVDNAQAFYAPPLREADTFYSARKFFGVSDGAYLYYAGGFPEDALAALRQDESWDRMSAQLRRADLGAEAGYADFQATEEALCGLAPARMSNLTRKILGSVDYGEACIRRRENYIYLASALQESNRIQLPLPEESVPMSYPYLAENEEVRGALIAEKVFVARYWPNVLQWVRPGTTEHELASKLIPLPVDQRYSPADLERVVKIIRG